MTLGDGLNSAASFAIGFFVGMAAYLLSQLVFSVFWPVTVILVLGFGGLLLLDTILTKRANRVLPTGLQPQENPVFRPKPLIRRLSLPVGFAIGLCVGFLGLSQTILELP
ncbi:MAG: hypothetical protein AAGF88_04360 [Pseudomonadota bacterium]